MLHLFIIIDVVVVIIVISLWSLALITKYTAKSAEWRKIAWPIILIKNDDISLCGDADDLIHEMENKNGAASVKATSCNSQTPTSL